MMARFKQSQACLIGRSARDETREGRDERARRPWRGWTRPILLTIDRPFYRAARWGQISVSSATGVVASHGLRPGQPIPQLPSTPLFAERSRWRWALAGGRWHYCAGQLASTKNIPFRFHSTSLVPVASRLQLASRTQQQHCTPEARQIVHSKDLRDAQHSISSAPLWPHGR